MDQETRERINELANNKNLKNNITNIISLIENSKIDEIDEIVIADFLEACDKINTNLREELTETIEDIIDLFITNRQNINNESLNKIYDDLKEMVNKIDEVAKSYTQNPGERLRERVDQINLRRRLEEQFKGIEDIYLEAAIFLSNHLNRYGERVYTDEWLLNKLDSLEGRYEIIDIANAIRNNGMEFPTNSTVVEPIPDELGQTSIEPEPTPIELGQTSIEPEPTPVELGQTSIEPEPISNNIPNDSKKYEYEINVEATLQNYRNQGFNKNSYGYFDPNISDYSETYDPLKDTNFQMFNLYELSKELDIAATLQNYQNQGFNKNSYGYFDPNISEYSETYNPLEDEDFQVFKPSKRKFVGIYTYDELSKILGYEPNNLSNVDNTKTSNEKEYEEKLEEYNLLLDLYNEDLDTLYELQKKYENKEIEYSEYEKFAIYMVERYKNIISEYEKITELYEKMNEANPLKGFTIEELQEKRNEIFKKIAEIESPEEYHFRVHQENGLEGHEDEFNKELKEIDDEISRRKFKIPEKPEQPMMILENDKIIVEPPVPPVDPPIEKEEKTTVEMIIGKIHGNGLYSVSPKESKNYTASQIKIYNKLPKNNLGNAYKLVSIGKEILNGLMTIPNLIKKFIGKLNTSDELKEKMDNIKKNIDNLSENEIQILIKEYRGPVVNSLGAAPAVNNMIYAKIYSYLMGKVNVINNRIYELLIEIYTLKNLIDKIEEKLKSTSLTEEERAELMNTRTTAYERCAKDIKEARKMKIEGDQILTGSTGLHGFSEGIRAGMSKMNRIGGRFATDYGSDAKLFDSLGEASRAFISDDPYEVVRLYFEYVGIYKENTKEKRSIRNLGSKVSVGKLHYDPFVRELNYNDDPFLKDLFTSIMIVTQIVSITNTIAQNIQIAQQNAAIVQHNAAIAQNNSQIAGYNQLRTDIQNSQGAIYDTAKTGAIRENYHIHEVLERENLSSNNWNVGSNAYQSVDIANHQALSQQSINLQNDIARLQGDFNAGVITREQLTQEAINLYNDQTQIMASKIGPAESIIRQYSQANPGIPYDAIFSGLDIIKNNPTAMPDVLQSALDRIIDANNLMPLNNLPQINSILKSQSIVPELVGLTATTALVNEHNKNNQKSANSTEWDKDGKFTKLLEMLKQDRLGKSEEIEQEPEEIEPTHRM